MLALSRSRSIPPVDSPTGATPQYLFVCNGEITPVHETNLVPDDDDVTQEHTLDPDTSVYVLVGGSDPVGISQYEWYSPYANE